MNFDLGLVASTVLTVMFVTTVTALFSSLLTGPASAWLERLAPSTRAQFLWLWAGLPFICGISVLVIVFLPSLIHLAGIAIDHCQEHGHHGHLCLVHSALFTGGKFELAILVLTGFILLAKLSGIALRLRRGYDALSTLLSIPGSSVEGDGYQVISSHRHFAFSVGLFYPRVFISSQLTEKLGEEELRAVLAHENGHCVRRDGLRMFIARLVSIFHFSRTRKMLLDELGQATEQCCDEIAAGSVGDRLLVAETILKLSRMISLQDGDLHRAVPAFTASDPSRRIIGLLNPPVFPFRWSEFYTPASLLALFIVGSATAEWWHHNFESLINLYFG